MVSAAMWGVSAAIEAQDIDAEIRAAFRRWCDAVNLYVAHPCDADCPQWCALFSLAEACADEVAALPALGAEGFAIKSYMTLRYALGGTDNEFHINWSGVPLVKEEMARRLIEDCARISPAIAEILGAAKPTSWPASSPSAVTELCQCCAARGS